MCSSLCWNVSWFRPHITAAAAHPILQRLAQWQAKNVSQLTLTLRPHYSPAVTEYPLIRIVWPMTFWKDFGKKPCRSRNQSRQWTHPFDKEAQEVSIWCICSMTSPWKVQHWFQFKTITLTSFVTVWDIFYKSTPWPHKWLSFKTNSPQLFGKQLARLLDLSCGVYSFWYVDRALKNGILRSQRPNTMGRFILSNNSQLYVWND